MGGDVASRALERVPEPVRSDPEFLACHRAREERARMARVAQARYRARQTRVILATTLAAVVGGLLLYGVDLPTLPEDAPNSAILRDWLGQDWVRIALGLLQAAALAGVAWGVHLVRGKIDDVAWLENRLGAENGRVQRAFTALRIGHRAGLEPFRAAGAYAVRELLDDQLAFFDRAKAQHTRNGSLILKVGGGIAAAGAGFAVLQGLGSPELVLAAALVGVLSPSLNAAVTSWEAMSGDMERARASTTAWFALTEVSGARGTFEAALTAQDLLAAEAYLERVADILRADHAAFEALRKAAKAQG